jgi:hypothetical protein
LLGEFPVSLVPSDRMIPLKVLDQKFLVEYPSKERRLFKTEALLPSDGLKLYTDGYLFEGRADSGVFFSEELDLKESVFLYFSH